MRLRRILKSADEQPLNERIILMYNDLSLAAEEGHLDQIRRLIAKGEDVNSFDALPLAAANGHLEIVEYLLKHGADIDQKGEHGRTALHNAVEKGHLPVVAVLLKNGASCNTQDKGYRDTGSPLTTALWQLRENRYEGESRKTYLKIIEALLKSGADPHFAVKTTTSDGLPSQVVAYELVFTAESDGDKLKRLFDKYSEKHKRRRSLFRFFGR